jgi:hypothetical protein
MAQQAAHPIPYVMSAWGRNSSSPLTKMFAANMIRVNSATFFRLRLWDCRPLCIKMHYCGGLLAGDRVNDRMAQSRGCAKSAGKSHLYLAVLVAPQHRVECSSAEAKVSRHIGRTARARAFLPGWRQGTRSGMSRAGTLRSTARSTRST